MACVTFSSQGSGKQAGCPTKRAPDAGDSAAFSSLFLRLSIFPIGRRSAARPSAGNANRWAVGCTIKKIERQRFRIVIYGY